MILLERQNVFTTHLYLFNFEMFAKFNSSKHYNINIIFCSREHFFYLQRSDFSIDCSFGPRHRIHPSKQGGGNKAIPNPVRLLI
jgi:hypothetical protein